MFVKVVSDIAAGGLDTWPDPQLRDALTSLESARSQLDAAQAQVLAELVRRGRVPETVFDTKVSRREATRRTTTAVALADGSLPGAVEALAAGAVAFEHVAALAEAKPYLPAGAAESLLQQAKDTPPDKFRRKVQRACNPVARVADGATGPCAGGGRWFRFEFDAYDSDVVINAFTKVIDQQWRADHPDRAGVKIEVPPYGQRLAQALLEMCRRVANGTFADPPGTDHDDNNSDSASDDASARCESGWTTPTPEAFLVIPYPMMIRDAEAAGIATTLDGRPLPADKVRKLLVDAKIYPVVVGADGEILDFGRGRRLFSSAQRKAIAVRDGTCQFADCDQPVRYTDAHHVQPWSQGGATAVANGAPACGDDHAKLTNDGYRLERRNGTTYTYDPNGNLIHRRTNRWRN